VGKEYARHASNVTNRLNFVQLRWCGCEINLGESPDSRRFVELARLLLMIL
jgi:hypothetical protein